MSRASKDERPIAAEAGGELFDLARAPEGASPVYAASPEGLDVLRHSTAHLMAQAIERLWPGTRFGIGPSIKDGFYYDVDLPEGKALTDQDLPAIEEEMHALAKAAQPIARQDMARAEALAFFEGRGDPYKTELIRDLPPEVETVSLYRQGEYVDLCRGPHVPDTSALGHFKLLSVAGAYWRGSEENEMLTRVYGTAFATAEELEAHLRRLEEARLRDHRKLGKELDLFSLHEEGPGFPFFHPKGMAVLNALTEFWRREHVLRGHTEIRTPQILDRDLWIRSGHWDHYRENMYLTEIDERPFAIKPMNCPGSILVYKSQLRSYRDLPMRLTELGIVHRHERSGVLHGLMRVRCFTQDDAHIFCALEQVKDEVIRIMDLCRYIYADVFGFKYSVELSTRPEDSMGTEEQWAAAEAGLREALEATGTPYRVNEGDGAFYGPKIDFQLEDCIGRSWQCGTVQLDFQLPERFDLGYIGDDGQEHRPVMLHRTILGSLERFFGILIEHYAGAFPFWIAPVQIRMIPIAEEHRAWAEELRARFTERGLRAEIDARDEKLGKRIRDAQVQKVPYMLVLGDKETTARAVSVRERSKGDLGAMDPSAFEELLDAEPSPLHR
ncbi:MAG: threonine--tRNA ligase [Synergistaceae bacterium]|nr:threonine--tRNA ligase [Synergistaceae bacterium]